MSQTAAKKTQRASKTAEFAALFRALEYAFPKERRLFEDPFAIHFLSYDLQLLACLARIPILGKLILQLVDRTEPGARASGVARTRLIDDHLTHALSKGIQQVVILGSGYDCRAFRIPECRQIRVFEVDQSGILNLKLARLNKLLPGLPRNVIFVRTDLNIDKLEQTLIRSGYDKNLPAFFIWEGVTQYLTEQAVQHTLQFIGETAPGSFLLFTYVHKQAIDSWLTGQKKRLIRQFVNQIGEPWIFGLFPEELSAILSSHGLELIEDVDSMAFRKRYMNPHGPHINRYRFYRAALACVKRKSTEPQIRFFRSFFRETE
ncbi:class I SAM-dependent methyltransferase [Thermoactinomyces mirandus]|uniref:S-adenosyl-L-methionine-dependent methyltransferase n=1 Tax=Thermoactinomyces mirandus TaxID=2756294 RepID=A0A7W2ARP3_9BACL|nr:SAM-dependent methyltransferase [Thermoactinomyces mirandus]MBA4601790.1 SAM-dependent methyltransferase [Thermoactinomyces mirandus]